LSLLCCVFMLFSCYQEKNDNKNILIATAANMHPAIKELTKEFTQRTGIKCELIISSSGKLTAQIKEGAPYDVFIAANMKYPNEIFTSGLATKLVLWTMIDDIDPTLDFLINEKIDYIALANPKTAPYGQAALEVLNAHTVIDSIQYKLVYGESIAQTNQFIISKAADLGFTAMSVVVAPEMKGKGKWIALDSDFYTPIQQGVVVVKHEKKVFDKAEKFYDFLFSNEAKQILINYGYSVDE